MAGFDEEDTDEQLQHEPLTGGSPRASDDYGHHDDGNAFYLNAEVLGKDDRALIMKYHYMKNAGLSQASEPIAGEKQGFFTKLKQNQLDAMGSMHASLGGAQNVGSYFAEILMDCTKKAMARLGYYCDVQPAYINGRDDDIFVAVRVSNLRVDANRVSSVALPCPAIFFKIFCACCPHCGIQPCWKSCGCCTCCVMPINVDHVAVMVENLLMDDPEAPLSIPVSIEGQVPHEEKLYLNRRGFYNAELPDAGEEVPSSVQTIKTGH